MERIRIEITIQINEREDVEQLLINLDMLEGIQGQEINSYTRIDYERESSHSNTKSI